MEPVTLNMLFALAVLGSVTVWLVFTYWQIKLIKRIDVVARSQHLIPENVFWLKRARMAIEADKICKSLVRKRNLWFMAVLSTFVVSGALMAYALLAMGAP